jgi:hypothetical protein
MKIFFKWLGISAGFLLAIILVKASSIGFANAHIAGGLAVAGGGAIILALLFYFMEVKMIPNRKVKIQNRIIALFGAYPVTDTINRLRIGNLDIFIETRFDLHLSAYGSYSESISFHIPKIQVDGVKTKPDFKYREAVCNGTPTYLIYQTNSMGLKKAKKKIEQKLLATSLSNRVL